MGPHGNRLFGTALVAVGLLMLLSEMGLAGLGWLWPTILLVMGIFLLVGFQRERDDSGKAFTGFTLVLLAFFFHFVHLDLITVARHWPFFLFAPGAGLLVMAQLDPQRRDAMVPGWILVGLSGVGYFFSLGIFSALVRAVFGLVGLVLKVTVPVALIALGGWLLFSQRRSTDVRTDVPEKVEPRGEGMGSSASTAAGATTAAAAGATLPSLGAHEDEASSSSGGYEDDDEDDEDEDDPYDQDPYDAYVEDDDPYEFGAEADAPPPLVPIDEDDDSVGPQGPRNVNRWPDDDDPDRRD